MKNMSLTVKLARFLIFLLAAYLWTSGASQGNAPGLTRSNFASSITSESITVFWVARDQGFFKRNGLDIQFIQMPRSALSVAALIAGEIDMAIIGGGHVLNAATSGSDVVEIAQFVQQLDYRFVGRPEIKRPEDLRGKRVAVSGIGAVSHIVALLALEKLGLDPDKQKITFVGIPGTEVNRRIALETGNVDATTLNGAVGDLYIKKGYSLLFNFRGSGVHIPQTVLATTRRTIAAKPQVVEGYLKAFIEAIAYLKDPVNKAVVVRIIASNLRVGAATAEEAYKTVVNSYERIPYPNIDGMRKLQTILAPINPKLSKVRPEGVVDAGLIDRLESSGFIKSVYKGNEPGR
jgi:ABC-type nitrate/sulfonate/bicarbonate transport system substrate-binding protein